MAKVFVGIPTYNRPRYVVETLDSVLSQTLQDLRVVVSDNASEPEASEAVERHVRELGDPRVTYHRQERNVQEYGQGRFLFAQCRDEPYFVILHDDDLFEPGYLEEAVATLDREPGLDCFAADPTCIDDEGRPSEEVTREYLETHQRTGRPEGPMDLLEPVMRCGFVPITATVFRTASLLRSGFVDDDCHGNYPFEFNLLLRLGEHGGRAWYAPRRLFRLRRHAGAMINTLRFWADPHIVDTMIKLLERRRFRGRAERRRRMLLAWMHNYRARIHLKEDDLPGCRAALRRAVRANPLCYRSVLFAGATHLVPFLVRRGRVRSMLTATKLLRYWGFRRGSRE